MYASDPTIFTSAKPPMSTKGATSLNRILRITAKLLFEKGEDVPSVANLLQGFVTPSMVRDWYERYCDVNGIEQSTNSKRNLRRMPMPPIDFQAVQIERLEEMLELPASDDDDMPEPEW
jgi:hypothetical protein